MEKEQRDALETALNQVRARLDTLDKIRALDASGYVCSTPIPGAGCDHKPSEKAIADAKALFNATADEVAELVKGLPRFS